MSSSILGKRHHVEAEQTQPNKKLKVYFDFWSACQSTVSASHDWMRIVMTFLNDHEVLWMMSKQKLLGPISQVIDPDYKHILNRAYQLAHVGLNSRVVIRKMVLDQLDSQDDDTPLPSTLYDLTIKTLKCPLDLTKLPSNLTHLTIHKTSDELRTTVILIGTHSRIYSVTIPILHQVYHRNVPNAKVLFFSATCNVNIITDSLNKVVLNTDVRRVGAHIHWIPKLNQSSIVLKSLYIKDDSHAPNDCLIKKHIEHYCVDNCSAIPTHPDDLYHTLSIKNCRAAAFTIQKSVERLSFVNSSHRFGNGFILPDTITTLRWQPIHTNTTPNHNHLDLRHYAKMKVLVLKELPCNFMLPHSLEYLVVESLNYKDWYNRRFPPTLKTIHNGMGGSIAVEQTMSFSFTEEVEEYRRYGTRHAIDQSYKLHHMRLKLQILSKRQPHIFRHQKETIDSFYYPYQWFRSSNWFSKEILTRANTALNSIHFCIKPRVSLSKSESVVFIGHNAYDILPLNQTGAATKISKQCLDSTLRVARLFLIYRGTEFHPVWFLCLL